MIERTKVYIEICSGQLAARLEQPSKQPTPDPRGERWNVGSTIRNILPTVGLIGLLSMSTLAQESMSGLRKAVRLMASSSKQELPVKNTFSSLGIPLSLKNTMNARDELVDQKTSQIRIVPLND